MRWQTSCRSDENSHFTITGVVPGEYRINVYKIDRQASGYRGGHQMLYQHDQKITINEQNPLPVW